MANQDLSCNVKIDDFYTKEVRGMLQDYPELNHILLERSNQEEYSPEEIRRYIKRALSRINMKPPTTRFGLNNFPETHWLLIVDGAVIEALKSKGLLKIRNEMNYQDQGGTTVRLEGKGQKYMQTAMNIYRQWQQELLDFKETLSVQSAWGGVYSEFTKDWW